MHSWLKAPSRNPPSFNNFISGAFQGPSSAVAIQRSLLNGGKMPHNDVQNLLSYKRGVTDSNRLSLESILETLAGYDLVWEGGPMVPWYARIIFQSRCWESKSRLIIFAASSFHSSALHPDHDSCTMNLIARFFLVFKHVRLLIRPNTSTPFFSPNADRLFFSSRHPSPPFSDAPRLRSPPLHPSTYL